MDQDIYMVNCLYHIQTVMLPYEFTKQKRENITLRLNDLLNDIAEEEVSVKYIYSLCDLTPLSLYSIKIY